MKYLSLFSGIEAASVAWEPLGWEPVGFAEIEKFPSEVLKYHYPGIKNYGDINNWKQWDLPKDIDLLVFGFPCQDLSVAGKRKGLKDEKGNTTRSGLFYRASELLDEIGCRWAVAENVPGLLSSNGGLDFASVVGELAGVGFDVPAGGWNNSGFAVGPKGLVEWCILDAQYVRVESYPRAVPQRRRRIFIVRDSGDWQSRPPLFLVPESLRRDTPPSRKTGERVAGTTPFGIGERSEVGHALRANASKADKHESTTYIAQPYTVGNCLTQRMHKGINLTLDEGQTPVLAFDGYNQELSETSQTIRSEKSDGDHVGMAFDGYSVRRLTPTECEALQGFPRNWTRIPWRGKEPENCPDGPRYKAIGNSMAVNVMTWIGERINSL